MRMSNSVKTISAMSLFVEDLQKAKSFYQEVFDVPVVFEDDVSVVVQFDNLIINLLQVSQAHTLIDPGVVAGRESGSRFQISIWVDDVDAVCSDLEQRGVTLLTRPTDREWGLRTATFTDPGGHSWEIAQDLSKSAGS
jgi:catechol 2,3-dioxygenase-like lactoylglutathione lyase family enzyme